MSHARVDGGPKSGNLGGMRRTTLNGLLAATLACFAPAAGPVPGDGPALSPPTVAEAVEVAPVWAGHHVGFSLLTHKDRQFVAYYAADRTMTVASRKLGEQTWVTRPLPSTIGWDSHNYITMAVDRDDHLHVSGNMHGHPLVYFRTTRPMDVASLEKVDAMTGEREGRVTYPVFITGPAGEFIFRYRDGGSGNGNEYYNLYDPATRTWRRLLDTPLTDGRGLMNAYPQGPVRGPDGYFHLCWVWRDTPDASTNHDLSYARSRDLVNWEAADGAPLTLPITLDQAKTVVDPVPAGGGMINGNTKIGFDTKKRVIVSYHKFDGAGKTQVYSRRWEGDRWVEYRTSDWDYRWDFGGGGTLVFEVGLGPVTAEPDGTLTQSYSNKKHGSGVWRLDGATLKPVGTVRRAPAHPPGLAKVESPFPGMRVNWAHDAGGAGGAGEPRARYVLRWETLPSNRDRPRPEPWPGPSTLRVYKLVDAIAAPEATGD